jgi:hypothetical protein
MTLTRTEALRSLYQPKAAEHVIAALKAIEDATASVTDEQRKAEFVKAQTDPETAKALAGAQVKRIEEYVLANTFALSFFELETLAPEDTPVEVVRTRDRASICHWISQSGKPKKRQITDDDSRTDYSMAKITTGRIEYPTGDINLGFKPFMKYRAEVEEQATHRLDMKLDTYCKALLDAGDLPSGLRATLNFESEVIQANLPDANYLDLSTEATYGTGGAINLPRCKAIMSYLNSWTGDSTPDRTPLRMTNIFTGAPALETLWDLPSQVAGYAHATAELDPKNVIPESARVELFRTGKIMDMFGYQFNWVPRNTLTAQYLYIATNKPVGTMWHKPAFDKAKTITGEMDEDLNRRMMEAFWMEKVIQFTLPSRNTYKYLIVNLGS